MNSKKICSFLLIATMIFSSLSIPIYGAERNSNDKDVLNSQNDISYQNKVDKSILEKLEEKNKAQSQDNGKIFDVIVHLKKKADLEKAKEKALDISYGNADIIERKAVIGSLQETSEMTQEGLIDYLKDEKKKGNVEMFESFYIINAVHVKASGKVIKEIAKRKEVDKIYENETLKTIKPIIPKEKMGLSLMSNNNESEIEWGIRDIGADRVWRDFGVDGTGVTVGIIDTGVYVNHPAIKNKWRGYDPNSKKQTAKGNYVDYVEGKAYPEGNEYNDHGTHVAGTITGEMVKSNGEKYNRIGVAPGAKFISARAFNQYGGDHAAILKCAEWMLAPGGEAEKAPDIVNNSWGGDNNTDTWFKEVIKNWRAANIMPIFAAGNLNVYDKEEAGTITNPGSLKDAFSVGAIDKFHKLASFSKWGPSKFPDTKGLIKPEIVAPGVQIRSCLATGGFASWNGTSMATPHISGVAALMKSADKNLTVEKMESILKETALNLTDSKFKKTPNMGYGYGEVSAYDAVAKVLGKNTGIIEGSVTTEGEDLEKPEIKAHFGKMAFINREFRILAEVSDNIAIRRVVASYSLDEGNTWNDLIMELEEGDSQNGKYVATIPKDVINKDNIRIKISAWDYGAKVGASEETEAVNIPVITGIDPTNYENDFEDDISGWSFDGVWKVGSPVGSKEPEVKSGNKYAGTDVGKDNYQLRVDSHLYLPPIDVSKSNGKPIVLKYQEYLGVDPSTYCALQYSKDGIHYEDFATRDSGLKEPEWKQVSYDLSKYSSDVDVLYLRFKLQGPPKDKGPGWYIDDVSITTDSRIVINKIKGLSIRRIGEGIRLNWAKGSENIIAGYKIYRKEANEGDDGYNQIGSTNSMDICEFEDREISEGDYTYKVTAFDPLDNESEGSLISIKYIPLENIIHTDFNNDGLFTGDGDWEWGIPVRTSDDDKYKTLYQKEYGLFDKIARKDKVWGTKLEGKMSGKTCSQLLSPEIEIPDDGENLVLEFSSYNTINFTSINSNIHFKVEIGTSGDTWTELIGPDEIMPFEKNSKWINIEKSLKPYAGQKIQLRFIADSENQLMTSKYELGWYIDNFRIGEKSDSVNEKGTSINCVTLEDNPILENSSEITTLYKVASSVVGTLGSTVKKYIPLNATVKIKETGKYVQTNSIDGKFQIKHAESIKGPWTLIAEAYGFFSEERPVTLEADSIKMENFVLRPKGKGGIEGTINDEKGEGVANALLRIEEDSNYGVIKADKKGHFNLDNIFEGSYTLKAFKDGFLANSMEITIKANQTINIDMEINRLEGNLTEEWMNRDNGEWGDQFTYPKIVDGPKGYAVKYRPLKKGGILKSMKVFIPTSKATNMDMSFGVLQHNDTGRLVEIAQFRKENLKPGEWNEISFAENNIKTDKTFYLVALQNHDAPNTLTVGIDTNKDIGTEGPKASYMFNGAFIPLEKYQKYGALMMRALMLFPDNAEENPADPNEWEGGTGGNTPIIQPDDEEAFIYDPSEYKNSGVKGFIKAYKGESEVLIIPGTIKGKKVRAIGDSVFQNKHVKEVKIPEGIEIIGENAFKNNFIQEITIPKSVKTIENSAFSGNIIQKLEIPENVTKIGKSAFSKNGLGEVTGMKGIREIPERAFYINPNIKMEIPNVVKIADDAFGPKGKNRKYALLFTKEGNPYNLHSKEGSYIINPAKIIMNLYDVEVRKNIEENIEILGNDGKGNYVKDYISTNPLSYYYVIGDKSVEIKAPKLNGYSNNESSKELKLSKSVNMLQFSYSDIELIMREPLFNCDKKIMALGSPGMNVEVQVNGHTKGNGTIDNDGYFSFNIDKLNARDQVVLINSDKHGNLHKSKIYIVQEKPTIDKNKPGSDLFILDKKGYLLRYLGNEENLKIPSSVGRRTITKIAPLTFCDMGIKSVDFSGNTGLDEIGNAAFAKNELTKVVFPNRLLHYGKQSFEYNKLETVQLSSRTHVINERAFHGNKIREVGIPGTVKHIRPRAFMDNNIETLTIPKHIETVEDFAFSNNNLKKVIFDEPLKGEVLDGDEEFESLGKGLFSGNDLTEVKLPESIKNVPDDAFKDNKRVVNIITSNNEVTEYVDKDHFGHIVNGVKIKFTYLKKNGEELLPSEILVGKDLKERTISSKDAYFKAGKNIEIKPKDIKNYTSLPVRSNLKSDTLNEITFIYQVNSGENSAGSGGSGSSGNENSSGGGGSGGGGGNSDNSEGKDSNKNKAKDKLVVESTNKNELINDSKNHNEILDKNINIEFLDIKDHWCRKAVLYTAKRGYFKGASQDKFIPDRGISRGEFVTVLGRMQGVNVTDFRKSAFSDVDIKAYYSPYINWAYEKGIIKGYSDKTFKAENKISREEMAVIFNNFIKVENIKVSEITPSKNFKKFTDENIIGKWALDSVNYLYKVGLVKGRDRDVFIPKGELTRGEVAQLLYNLDIILNKVAA